MNSKSGGDWFKSAFGPNDSSSNNSTAAVRASSRRRANTTSASNNENGPLPKKSKAAPKPVRLEAFTPTTIDDLAVHPKKITELTEWLTLAEELKRQCPRPMLLITGPSGCGKTIALNIIAKSLGYSLTEWINPVDIDLSRNMEVDGAGNYYKEGQLNLFRQFLFKASRYQSLFEENTKRLILIKDFPNIFLKNQEAFDEVLERYMTFGKCPLVFIATDTQSKELNIAYKLFSDATREKHHIGVINFNAVAVTLMKRAMKRIVCLMTSDFSSHYNFPNGGAVEEIAVMAQGDLRNAMLSMHFKFLKGCSIENVATTRKNAKDGKTEKGTVKGSKKQSGTDETLTVMHALGRVFHPKYEVEAPDKLLYNPEQMAEHFQSQPSTFISLINANYIPHFTEMDDIVEAADCLSLCNVLSTEYRDEDLSFMGLCVGIRGVMLHNRKTAAGWIPVRGVRKIVVKDVDCKKMNIPITTSKNDVSVDYLHYAKIIQSQAAVFKTPYPVNNRS